MILPQPKKAPSQWIENLSMSALAIMRSLRVSLAASVLIDARLEKAQMTKFHRGYLYSQVYRIHAKSLLSFQNESNIDPMDDAHRCPC